MLSEIRLVLFLVELNSLESQSTDIGNAYLEAKTKEKVYAIARKEFSDFKGCVLLISKVLCRLCSLGLYQHKRLTDCLKSIGFFPCEMEPGIWIRDCGGDYECIAVHTGNLLIASKDPRSIFKHFLDNYKLKSKGNGLIKYYLG